MTYTEQIMHALATLASQGKETFTRRDVRDTIGVRAEDWHNSYSPTFQGMRIDQPGGAPNIAARFKGVVRRVWFGHYTMTSYGKEFLCEFTPAQK